ncbi:MAG: ribosome-associated translation inhibitor RaiA [Bacteroidota bacterium]
MKLQIQSIHFTAADHLKQFTQEKMAKLDHFFDRITDGEVFFKLQNEVKGANKFAEIKVHVPGEILIASEKGKSFEEALDLALEKVKSQLRKYKGKLQERH